MSMFEKIFKPKTEAPPGGRIQETEEKPHRILYEDEEGDTHELEGILEAPELSHRFLGPDIQGMPRDFWYIDTEGRRIKIKNARSWQYHYEDESEAEKAERIEREVKWQEEEEKRPTKEKEQDERKYGEREIKL